MDESASGPAGLMRRIVQLEKERDELQRDIETLCMQQSGFSGSIDIVSRIQARRAAGFEQELETCKQKLAVVTQENLSLQEELAETYRAKGRVADAFKGAMDKNKELEKEVKFYQTRMAGAFSERDKALMEVEKLHSSETSLVDEVKELHKRLMQANVECSEHEKSYLDLQESIKPVYAANEKLQMVVDKFWLLRQNAREDKDECEDPLNRAQILLEDEVSIWTYGFMVDPKWQEDCKAAEVNLARAEEKFVRAEEISNTLRLQLEEEILNRKQFEERLGLTEAASANFKLQIEDEINARRLAEHNASVYSDHLAKLKTNFQSDLQQLQGQHRMLITDVSAILQDERTQMLLTSEALLSEIEKEKEKEKVETARVETLVELQHEPETSEVEVTSEVRLSSPHLENEPSQVTSTSREEEALRDANVWTNMDDESKKILAQALQEKVEALLLLSQQEERHYLESATKSALESQVTELKQKLAQVTGEKVSALMDLAEQRNEVHYLQERERELAQLLEQHRSTNAGGRLLPATWSESKLQVMPDDSSILPALQDKPVVNHKQPSTATRGYLKTWLRGLDISSSPFKSIAANGNKAVTPPVTISTRPSDDSNNGVARLLVENAALQERVASVQHLAQSAHRLRMILVKVATDLEGEPEPKSIQAAMDVVETVKAEARRLKVALGCSLPVSYQGPLENSPEDLYVVPLTEGLEVSEGQTNVALDSVSLAGIEIAELLLATSELQRSALLCRLDSPHTVKT
ncbi:hypothetical protein MPTK1_2g04080 [Marchantia polymorpha subsp. ruderalis]|uniref:Uncharacterized protein n=2 Tax=Marchantia polymorpha TaxID=3197 RepID=A0A2R6X7K5_MARPO|nr:hypothetical protein MARPO_0031s0064 [Marchantia polymorpha]BBN01037.1 hypothetical protein Mp_2g04080 [Marchantia polymorpha subsp. ruderalis]|eukprot:PTQ42086.1 hypothetical protein MARPO_0031s0064 [Marchantia polymorpha]